MGGRGSDAVVGVPLPVAAVLWGGGGKFLAFPGLRIAQSPTTSASRRSCSAWKTSSPSAHPRRLPTVVFHPPVGPSLSRARRVAVARRRGYCRRCCRRHCRRRSRVPRRPVTIIVIIIITSRGPAPDIILYRYYQPFSHCVRRLSISVVVVEVVRPETSTVSQKSTKQ